MSQDKETKNLEEEVVVNETTEMVVAEENTKKAKVVKVAKTVGKVAAVAGIGILGFILGRKSASGSDYDDSEEVIDVDYVDVEQSEEE